MGSQSCLCRARQCLHKTVRLCGDPGSGRWSWGYNEDQIDLMILDISNFMARVPVILGMPTIGCVVKCNEIGREMDALVMPWVNARVAHLLSVHRMMPMEVGDSQKEKFDTNDNDQLMYNPECRNYRALSLLI